ncbi:type II secretion system protein GspC [Thalassotalea maritima]|uniref:type II secretion system protein GspC n=1 Tax=Thalassotalea maritima TaxID=3242416 RepID=UPI0035273943
MDLAQITHQFQTLWQKVPQKALSQVLLVVLFIYLAYWAAATTWLLVPQPVVTSSPSTGGASVKQKANSAEDIDINAITKLNLFGEYNKPSAVPKPVPQVESAPQTKLRLTLTGVVASDDISIAAAIIESQGTQETYGIDDKITGTRAVLKQVHADRVIIESAGRMETLMLDGFEYSKQINGEATQPKNDKRSLSLRNVRAQQEKKDDNSEEAQARIKQRVAQLKTDILNDPSKITDYLRISPYRREGKVVGYRLMPSKDPEFFQEVGLIAGDIAVQINGRDLTDMREAQQALMELRSAEHVDLLVERDGVLHDISLGL